MTHQEQELLIQFIEAHISKLYNYIDSRILTEICKHRIDDHDETYIGEMYIGFVKPLEEELDKIKYKEHTKKRKPL